MCVCVYVCVCVCVYGVIQTSYCSPSLSSLSVTVDIVTPRDVTQRGCQLSLSFSKPVTEVHSELKKLGIVVCTLLGGEWWGGREGRSDGGRE